MATEWLSDGPAHDTGNGALRSRHSSADYPGVVQICFSSYCGREPDDEWYEATNDNDRLTFRSPAAAQQRYNQLAREQRAEKELAALKADLARRGIRA